MRYPLALFCVVALAACSRSAGSPLPAVQPNGGLGPDSHPGAAGYNVVYSFNGPTGAIPSGGLIAVKGLLYGVTLGGGAKGLGTVFQTTSGGTEKVLYSFRGSKDAIGPNGLTLFGGVLYGTSTNGGNVVKGLDDGTVFSVTFGGTERVLHAFRSGPTSDDGKSPYAPLTLLNGVLYGSTLNGGKDYGGTVFSVTSAGAVRTIFNFRAPSKFRGPSTTGSGPNGPMAVVNGKLYGATSGGGAKGCGAVFSLTPAGVERVIYSFQCGKDGNLPLGGLVAFNGVLYGTTDEGGTGRDPLGSGTVFSLATSGKKRTLALLDESNSGYSPRSALVVLKGTIYGTAAGGGTSGGGTLFSVAPSGNLSVLHSFGAASDGSSPSGLGTLGNTLYGETARGGAKKKGTIFSVSP